MTDATCGPSGGALGTGAAGGQTTGAASFTTLTCNRKKPCPATAPAPLMTHQRPMATPAGSAYPPGMGVAICNI
eukprot:9386094-Pyramimonas_sp.AAC.2